MARKSSRLLAATDPNSQTGEVVTPAQARNGLTHPSPMEDVKLTLDVTPRQELPLRAPSFSEASQPPEELNVDQSAQNNLDQNVLLQPSSVNASTSSQPQPHTHNTESTSASQTANLELLGAGARKAVHTIRDLASYGVDATIPLPKIVVVGDQSAGKSSLIEGISEIRVPRDIGTCTRCPLEINLEPTDDTTAWQCVVTVHKKYDYGKSILDSSERESGGGKALKVPFYPWIERPTPVIYDFQTVYDTASLEQTIKRAQFATLNPASDPRQYASNAHVSLTNPQVDFSPNIVCLKITGPGLPNLTFYDLPGVIAQSENETDGYKRLVKDLVKYYVQQENTLVLVAMPMDQDPQNSKASGIVRSLNIKHRCIGVLTKPDRILHDSHNQDWRRIFKGELFPLGHGYFVTKQPSKTELEAGVNHAQARHIEAKFFDSEGWTAQFPDINDRSGTPKLAEHLSNMLAHLIMLCLPKIREQVSANQAEIDSKLRELPDSPANAATVIRDVVTQIHRLFRQHIHDEGHPQQLWAKWSRQVDKFQIQITKDLRPAMTLSTSLEQDGNIMNVNNKRLQAVDVSDDDQPGARSAATTLPGTVKRTKTTMATPPTRVETPSSAMNKKLRNVTNEGKHRFNLEDMKITLDRYNVRGLPGQTNPRAIDEIMRNTVKNWHHPVRLLIATLEKTLTTTLCSIIQYAAKDWAATDLYNRLQAIATDFVVEQIQDQRTTDIDKALRIEQTYPHTKDGAELKRRASIDLGDLTSKRYERRVRAHLGIDDSTLNDQESPAAIKAENQIKAAVKNPDTLTKLGVDPFKREVEAVAQIRAYYDIAASRFVDTICNIIEGDLFVGLEEGLVREFECKLGIGDGVEDGVVSALCEQLLEEDRARALERERLKGKKRMLELACMKLRELDDDVAMAG